MSALGESETEDISDEIEDIDIGLIIGAGMDIPVGTGAVTLDVSYNLGLMDIAKGSGDVTNRVISFMIGYKI